MLRGCPWKSMRRWRLPRAIRTWNGPMPTAIPRNMPRPAGRAMTVTSSAGRNAKVMPSISPASTSFISTRRSSTATIASSSSAMTNTGPGKCAMRLTTMSNAAERRRALPATSCGRRGWKTAASGRFATSTDHEQKTPPIARQIRREPAAPGKQPRSVGRGRRHSGSMPPVVFMSVGAAALRVAHVAFRSIGRSIGPSPERVSTTVISSARKAMRLVTRLMASTILSVTACRSRRRTAARRTGSKSSRSACRR
ncbi:hypothetical protein D9M70_509630 [compost metagenome]